VTEFAATAGEPDLPVSAGPIYRDRHETSLPLLLLGVVVTASAAIQLAGGLDGLFADWTAAVALTIVFAGLWLTFRRRATVRGMTCPPGFGIAAIIGLVAVLPPFFVTVVYAGPFLVFGLGLATAGIKVRNRLLAGWGLAVGGIGVFEGFFGITNRLSISMWASWEHSAIYLLLGILTVIAGIVIRIRETRASG
jgi:hypothetical protein